MSSITVSPTTTTTYTVTAISPDGCVKKEEVIVKVNPLPQANAGDNQTICENDMATLLASGGTSYMWNTADITAKIITPALLNTTTYSVTVTENKCTDTDEVIVFVQPNPVANAGDNQTICANTSALLMASGGDTYLWNSGANTNSFTTPVLVSQTTYTVTVSEKKCSDTDDVGVFIAIPPLADAGEDKSIFANQLAHLFATGGDTYLWSTSQTNADISPSPLENTTYTVTVTKNGCTNTDDVSVVVYALPTIHLGEDMLVCSRDSVHIQSYSTSGNLTYDWLDRDDTTAGIGEVALKNASYTLLVTDEHSCTAQDVVNVVVVPLPLSPKIDDVAICKSVSNNAVLRIKSPSKE